MNGQVRGHGPMGMRRQKAEGRPATHRPVSVASGSLGMDGDGEGEGDVDGEGRPPAQGLDSSTPSGAQKAMPN